MLVPTAESYEALSEKLDRVLSLLEQHDAGAASREAYIEPGPGRRRQFFTAQELAKRWGWGKTKVYELLEEELPAFSHGGTRRFFWSYVWAFEGRITRQEADRIWKDYGSLSASKLTELPRQAARPSRLRPVRTD